jgi:hypothetical protein
MSETNVVNENEEVQEEENQEVKSIHVAMVLDRSGSMSYIRDDIIGSFNEQLEEIRKNAEGIPTKVSLITFADNVDEPKFFDEEVDCIKPLSSDNYRPGGATAMYDAIGETLELLINVEDADDEGTRFLVIVLSDGQENNSSKFSRKAISKIVKQLKEDGKWTLTYVGANQDLEEVAEALSLTRSNMMAFAATGEGVQASSMQMKKGIGSYYENVTKQKKGATKEVDGFFDDEKDQD